MLPRTQAWSRARTKALFDEEQAFIAPGLQTIALLPQLAIERGRGATLVDLDGRAFLDLNAGVSVASLAHSHPRYVAALTAQLEAVTAGSFTSRRRTARGDPDRATPGQRRQRRAAEGISRARPRRRARVRRPRHRRRNDHRFRAHRADVRLQR